MPPCDWPLANLCSFILHSLEVQDGPNGEEEGGVQALNYNVQLLFINFAHCAAVQIVLHRLTVRSHSVENSRLPIRCVKFQLQEMKEDGRTF
jgi:hypothetical protein